LSRKNEYSSRKLLVSGSPTYRTDAFSITKPIASETLKASNNPKDHQSLIVKTDKVQFSYPKTICIPSFDSQKSHKQRFAHTPYSNYVSTNISSV